MTTEENTRQDNMECSFTQYIPRCCGLYKRILDYQWVAASHMRVCSRKLQQLGATISTHNPVSTHYPKLDFGSVFLAIVERNSEKKQHNL
jgi:hypothetical protein